MPMRRGCTFSIACARRACRFARCSVTRSCARRATPRRLERRKILEDHQAGIAAQIVELQQAHALLTHKIANYKKIEERIRINRPALSEPEVDCELEPVS